MKKLTNFFKKLWRNESGQGATEYILLLVVIVGLVMLFKNDISRIVKDKVQSLGADIQGITSQ
jgi:Flp pilus assembly pilin Flp